MKGRAIFRKAHKLLLISYRRYKKERDSLEISVKERIKRELLALEEAILKRDREKTRELYSRVQDSFNQFLRPSLFERIRNSILGSIGALAVAILIRQLWFELYEIPTGSMRPTIEEQDKLAVSKVDFGINYPLTPGHFHFDQEALKRNQLITFTVKNLDFPDGDTRYFGIFPGKKMLVKRLIGKPGDQLYFYGGKVYGVDEKGVDISPDLQPKNLEKIEHIPFDSFEGTRISAKKRGNNIFSPVTIYQMNQPIIQLEGVGIPKGSFTPEIKKKYPSLSHYQIWGIDNFAMARILTEEQAAADHNIKELPKAPLYLELHHHPSFSPPKMGWDEYGRMRPSISSSLSIIPLEKQQLKKLILNLYTARFLVRHGFCYPYSMPPSEKGYTSPPQLPQIPDGTYEFYYGVAYQIQWGGIRKQLLPSHPIYQLQPKDIQTIFNLGIEFDNRFNPPNQRLLPSRYAYFRDGDLYLMGAPIFDKEDPILIDFVNREQRRAKVSSHYFPFIDQGAPYTLEGELDRDRINKYGLRVPAHSYLVLGDNHSNSRDSRDFGWVPEANLRGRPLYIFWPPGRWGALPQSSSSPFRSSRMIIWLIISITLGTSYYIHLKRSKLPLNFDEG